jgi:hypothetical protein
MNESKYKSHLLELVELYEGIKTKQVNNSAEEHEVLKNFNIDQEFLTLMETEQNLIEPIKKEMASMRTIYKQEISSYSSNIKDLENFKIEKDSIEKSLENSVTEIKSQTTNSSEIKLILENDFNFQELTKVRNQWKEKITKLNVETKNSLKKIDLMKLKYKDKKKQEKDIRIEFGKKMIQKIKQNKEITKLSEFLIFFYLYNVHYDKFFSYYQDSDFMNFYLRCHQDLKFCKLHYPMYLEFTIENFSFPSNLNMHWYSTELLYHDESLDFQTEMKRIERIHLSYVSSFNRRNIFDIFMFLLNQIQLNKSSGVASSFLTKEIEDLSVIRFSMSFNNIKQHSALFSIWFFLENYGHLNSGMGYERWIFYQLWKREDYPSNNENGTISILLSKYNMNESLKKFQSFNSKLSNFLDEMFFNLMSIKIVSVENNLKKEVFVKEKNLKTIKKQKIDTNNENENYIINLMPRNFADLICECIEIIFEARWNECNFIVALFRISKNSKESLWNLTLLEAIELFVYFKNNTTSKIKSKFKIYNSLKTLSHLILDSENNIFKLDLNTVSSYLKKQSCDELFSDYHNFGKQLFIYKEHYLEETMLNPKNSEIMLKMIHHLDKISKFSIKDFLTEETSLKKESSVLTVSMKYNYSLLIPKVKNDFETFRLVRESFKNQNFYISSLESSLFCNCYLFEDVNCENIFSILKFSSDLFSKLNLNFKKTMEEYLINNSAYAPRLSLSLPTFIINLMGEGFKIIPHHQELPWRFCKEYNEAIDSFQETIKIVKSETNITKIEEPIFGLAAFTNSQRYDPNSFYLMLIGGFNLYQSHTFHEFDFMWITVQKNSNSSSLSDLQISIVIGEVKTGGERAIDNLKERMENFKFSTLENITMSLSYNEINRHVGFAKFTLFDKRPSKKGLIYFSFDGFIHFRRRIKQHFSCLRF